MEEERAEIKKGDYLYVESNWGSFCGTVIDFNVLGEPVVEVDEFEKKEDLVRGTIECDFGPHNGNGLLSPTSAAKGKNNLLFVCEKYSYAIVSPEIEAKEVE